MKKLYDEEYEFTVEVTGFLHASIPADSGIIRMKHKNERGEG